MNKSGKHLLWLLPLVLLGAFWTLSKLANAWLESAGGKRLLEREFSASFGHTVRLTGSFRISLFPRIAIEGSGFELEALQVRRLLARADDYSVAIQLLPFLQQEVRIASVTLQGGFLDLGVFIAAADQTAPAKPQEFSIPEVSSLIIEDFALVFGDASNIIGLSRVELDEFGSGREARLAIDAGWSRDGIEIARVMLDGGLQIGSKVESAQIKVNELEVTFGGSEVTGLSGSWDWSQSAAQVSGDMSWNQGTYAVHSEIEIKLAELITGEIHARLAKSPDAPVANARVGFAVYESEVALPEVTLEWDGQVIAGTGCYRLGEPPGLRLAVAAETLDLDRISAHFPSGAAGDTPLPFDLSLELRVENASYMGARAHNMNVKIGGELGCGGAAGIEIYGSRY